MGCNCDTYNGYENRETAVTGMWLTNEESFLTDAIRFMYHAKTDVTNGKMVGETLEAFFAEYTHPSYWREVFGTGVPDEVVSMMADIGSMWRVNWEEVAGSILDVIPDYMVDVIASEEEEVAV